MKAKRSLWIRAVGYLVMMWVWLALVSGPASAQAIYQYTGNPFSSFSSPTSYTASDFVTATLTLNQPLPGGLNLQNVTGLAGFRLTMGDGLQVLTDVGNAALEVLVSTDATGQIIGPWSLIINCCLFPNNGIATLNWPGVRGVADEGRLSAPDGSFPGTPFDLARVFSSPGRWSRILTPAVLVSQIQTLVDIGVLNKGEGHSLIAKLDEVMASLNRGNRAAACGQIGAFINQVNAFLNAGRLTPAQGQPLIAAATLLSSITGC